MCRLKALSATDGEWHTVAKFKAMDEAEAAMKRVGAQLSGGLVYHYAPAIKELDYTPPGALS